MTTTTPRALISAMQVTLDGYVLGPGGDADSFESWADGLELLPPVEVLVTSLINTGLLDELRLIVHPVAAGGGMSLFGELAERQALEFVSAAPMGSGRINLTYRLATDATEG
jgi:hypothetical protein